MAENIQQMNLVNSILGYVEYLQNVNQSASNMVGIDLLYFRAVPHENGESLIFQEYTLLDVECQKQIKGVVKNPEYANGFEVDLFGVKYDSPLQIQFDLKTWNSVFGEGTMPQKDDIVYVPVLNRLFEVNASTPIYTFANQLTAYQADMTKYSPKAYRAENEELIETLKDTTVSTIDLFGQDISDQIKDITDNKDFSPYNSTSNEGDWYKEVEWSCIVDDKLVIDGFDISNGYYDMRLSDKSPIVRYKNSSDYLSPDSEKPYRFFSCWFKFCEGSKIKQHEVKEFKLYNKVNRMSQFAFYCSGNYSIGQQVIISRGSILRLPGTIIEKLESKGYYLVEISTSEVLKVNKKITNWTSSGLKIESSDGTIFLLGGNSAFSISIEGRKILKVQIGSLTKTYSINSVLGNSWYGIAMNIGSSSSGLIIDSNTDIIEKFDLGKISVEEEIESYQIDPSNCQLAHIHLYEFEKPITNEFKMINDLLSEHSNNASRAIINDKPEIRNTMPYIGMVR